MSLAGKQTVMVTLTFVLPGDLDPQVQITEGPDPVGGAIALGAVLWSD